MPPLVRALLWYRQLIGEGRSFAEAITDLLEDGQGSGLVRHLISSRQNFLAFGTREQGTWPATPWQADTHCDPYITHLAQRCERLEAGEIGLAKGSLLRGRALGGLNDRCGQS